MARATSARCNISGIIRYDTAVRRFQPLIASAMCAMCISIADEAHAQLRSRLLATGFTAPLAFVQDPTDRNVQFVVQQDGRIRVVQNGSVVATDFLNVRNGISFEG